jgi:hypothetical protein
MQWRGSGLGRRGIRLRGRNRPARRAAGPPVSDLFFQPDAHRGAKSAHFLCNRAKPRRSERRSRNRADPAPPIALRPPRANRAAASILRRRAAGLTKS